MTDSSPQISVVLPAHDEEGNVAAMAERLGAIRTPAATDKAAAGHIHRLPDASV